MVRIPLRDRTGEVIAHALVDDCDSGLAEQRWYRHSAGYAMRKEARGVGKWRQYFMHREVLGLEPGDGRACDHINRDRLDNRRSNLRVATSAENMQNRGSLRGTSSRFRGVSWHKRDEKWTASACVNGRTTYLGNYESEGAAADAVSAFRAEHMPYAVERAA